MPNLALVGLLSNFFDCIHYIATPKDKELITTMCPSLIFHDCNSVKLHRPITNLNNLLIPFKLHQSKQQAKKILSSIKPDIIFSKGGYASLPILQAAKQLNIPYILHESDKTLGLANALCAKNALYCLGSFESSIKKLKNGIHTGSPIRQNIYKGDPSRVDTSNFDDKPIVLILGGSSGSIAINNCIRLDIDQLTKQYNIIHITGKNHSDDFRHTGYIQIPFAYNIGDYLSIADMVVARAGANTLFELIALAKPTLAIPLPKTASRGDQIQNAKHFGTQKCILTLNQEDLTPTSLQENLAELYNQRQTLIQNCKSMQNIDGTKKIVDTIIAAVTKQE